MKKTGITALAIVIGIFIALTPAAVASAGNMDVVLVMDSSGSMKKTDPHFLRIPAAKLFISLLREGDRASVVSFSDKGYMISPLIPVADKANVSSLNRAAEKISSKGLFTNLYEAFNTGMRILSDTKAPPDREKVILIMTDGMMDTGDSAEDGRLLDLIDSELLGRMKEQNIKVYSIAFTRLSDQKLLAKISKKTGGFYNLALTDKELHLIFTSIFESLEKPDMLPMTKNAFLIDSSVKEVTIVATKGSPGTDIQLLSPDGQKYSGSRKYSGISWFESETFDMITIERPLEGRWEILMSTGEDNKAYVITDLSLKTNFNNLYSLFGQPMDINIWLEKNGETIVEPEVLGKIEFYIELTGPDGKTSRLEPFLKEAGIFERKIAPFTPGNYTMNIVAKSMTFERKKTFIFNSATVEESKEDLKEQKSEAEKAPVSEQQEVKSTEDTDISWGAVAFKFIAINLILGIGVLAYLKRDTLKKGKIGKLFKKGGDEEDENDSDEDEDYSPSDDETGDSADTEEKSETAAENVPPAEAVAVVEEKAESGGDSGEATENGDESPAEQEEEDNVKAEAQPADDSDQTDTEEVPAVKIKLDSDTHESEGDKATIDTAENEPGEDAEASAAEAEEHDLESADDTGEQEHEEKPKGTGASQAELAKLEEELLNLSQEDESDDASVHHESDPADFLDELTGKDEPEKADESSGAEPEMPKADTPEVKDESDAANDQNMVDDIFEQLSSGTTPQSGTDTDQQDEKQEAVQEIHAPDVRDADESGEKAEAPEQDEPVQTDKVNDEPEKIRADKPDDPEPAGTA